jgi:hypothetical protein
VKFREEKLRFDVPRAIAGKAIKASRNLDLTELGLDPGDELYFYVIAFDNRKPQRNYSRTETFFISLKDTADADVGFDGSLGVDLMPEYFRSQRQIIIDSEKLQKEKPHITKRDFDSRSNELAHDQKVLRLRYGQFLGEEFETGIVHEEADTQDGNHDHDTDDESDVTKKFGHVHDGDNEHNLVPDHEHEHGDGAKKDEEDDPIKGFVHRHDDPEEATFFTQSIRAKLKATLSIMWDAELHLRLSDPAKSLPHQYRALKLLKEISNDSRIYVHKTGFDAPPLKEEKRLTGELDEVRGTVDRYAVSNTDELAALSDALKLIETKVHSEHALLSENDKGLLRKAAEKVAVLAVETPGRYLETLSILQRITKSIDSSPSSTEDLKKIGESLGNILPAKPDPITLRGSAFHRADSLFVKNLFER